MVIWRRCENVEAPPVPTWRKRRISAAFAAVPLLPVSGSAYSQKVESIGDFRGVLRGAFQPIGMPAALHRLPVAVCGRSLSCAVRLHPLCSAAAHVLPHVLPSSPSLPPCLPAFLRCSCCRWFGCPAERRPFWSPCRWPASGAGLRAGGLGCSAALLICCRSCLRPSVPAALAAASSRAALLMGVRPAVVRYGLRCCRWRWALDEMRSGDGRGLLAGHDLPRGCCSC